jgi:signal transduction histidine kinase/CheY-like chemotaxis protein
MRTVLGHPRRAAPPTDYWSDLRPSPGWLLGLLAGSATLLALLSEIAFGGPAQSALRYLVVLLFALAGLGWLANAWHPLVGRWIAISGVAGLILLLSGALQLPAALVLLGLPVLFAAQLVGLVAASAVAAGQSALLGVLLARGGLEGAEPVLALALIAIWMTWLGLVAIYRPIYALEEWVARESERAMRIIEDARDRKAELEQTVESLVSVNRQLALANERIAALRHMAEEAQSAKAQFVAKVSHEFRTPLNMIIGLVNLMVDNPRIYTVTLPPEMTEDLEIVRRNCQHLASMVNDVLSLAQIEARQLVLHRERVDLSELVRAAVEAVSPLSAKKKLALEVDIEEGMPRVYCDRTRIQQVVLNLVSNAARFTDHGAISVEARRLGAHADRVLVCVRDTGPGIAPDDTKRIFEPFYQAQSDSRRDRGGTGLGLAISREFVHRHGGRMWLDSELGVGTTFSFELPISELPEPVARPGHRIRDDWVWRQDAFMSPIRVAGALPLPRVVVWDQGGGLIPELDGHAEEVEFIYAGGAADVDDALRQAPAHAVIVNTAQPDALPALVGAARHVTAGTPLIGCSVPRRVERALRAGAAGYLVKPVSPADLWSAINSVHSVVERVLVVDDDPDFVRMVTRMLAVSASGLQVAGATSGAEALGALRDEPVDLVLLDVMMPEMDGWQVLARKNADPALRPIPAFLVSARDPVEEPPVTSYLLAASDGGLTAGQVLACALDFSARLLSSSR